jgi:hypothetical protein
VPGTAWVHLPMTMGYDRYPELLIDEKTALLGDLCERGAYLFYTHDPKVAMSRLRRGDGGRLQAIACERIRAGSIPPVTGGFYKQVAFKTCCLHGKRSVCGQGMLVSCRIEMSARCDIASCGARPA